MNKENSFISLIRPPQPILFLVTVYFILLVFFFLYRLYFNLYFIENVYNEPFYDILMSYVIGVRFDTATISLALVPLILLLPWLRLNNKLVKYISVTYLTIIFSFMILILLADTRFYSYFGIHLNYLAYEYIGDGDYSQNLVMSDPEFTQNTIIWLVLTVLSIWVIVKTYSYFQRRGKQITGYNFTGRLIFFLILAAVAAFGARGRLGVSPLDWGVALNTQNHFINQLPLNGIYTLFRSYSEDEHDPRLVYLDDKQRFALADLNVALQTTKSILATARDEWLNDSTLFRITRQPTNRFGFSPNIVIVLMESWTARYTGSMGAPYNLTPYFDSLTKEGIFFPNFYASGTRTNFGLAATLCSFPAVPGRAILKRYNAFHPFVSLSEILNKRGYYNAFSYGGDYVFDNMKGFFTTKKYDRFLGVDDFGKNKQFSKWGIPDYTLFEETIKRIDSLPRPFQLTILTLSNHEPYDLPDSSVQRFMDDSYESKIYNGQLYADYALNHFMNLISNNPVFDSTIFIFTADHSKLLFRKKFIVLDDFHIPLLLYSPLLKEQAHLDATVGGQVDILPTIMGLIGGDYIHSSWGRDLLNMSENDNGFATVCAGNRIACVSGNFLYAEQLGYRNYLYYRDDTTYYNYLNDSFPDVMNSLQTMTRHYMQTADMLSTPMMK